jgi:hypothetical protein
VARLLGESIRKLTKTGGKTDQPAEPRDDGDD